MKRSIGISPILIEMVFVLLFFSLSCTVVLKALGTAAIVSRDSREKSEALEAANAAIETMLADEEALEKQAAQTIHSGEFTIKTQTSAQSRSGGTYYTVECRALKDENVIVSLSGGRFVRAEDMP